jgi:ribonuclease D
VLCSRDRMEAVARKNPETRAELDEVSELRNWQRDVLGDGFLKALKPHQKKKPASSEADSPYRE